MAVIPRGLRKKLVRVAWRSDFTHSRRSSATLPNTVAPPASGSSVPLLLFAGGAIGAAVTYAGLTHDSSENLAIRLAEAKRQTLPDRIILVRHGQSEGNADMSLYRTKADNLIELTETGSQQAKAAGKRLSGLLREGETVALHVSPFQRTLQTSRNIREAIEEHIMYTHIDPRIREQEFGNLQGDDFKKFREEQTAVGRFFYRFPTGESGADVYCRTKSWFDSVLEINVARMVKPGEKKYHKHIDTVIVVTHGLTMRLILMQLNSWSPNTFNSVWNAGNCDLYVLKKDLSRSGAAPYVLDADQGDMPESSAKVLVEFTNGKRKHLELKHFLALPQPRSFQPDIARTMLAEQHGLDATSIKSIDFFNGMFKKFK